MRQGNIENRYHIRRILTTFLCVVTVLLAGLASTAAAQDIGSVDFENLRSSDLSDQQVQQLWERAQDQGYSLSDLQQIAIVRGASPGEVSKLVRRVRELQTQSGQGQDQQQASQLRQVSGDTLLSQRPDMLQDTTEESRIFGADLFNSEHISFVPSLNIPTPDNYQLGAGDELVVDIWGGTDENFQLQVNSEGTVNLPRVGPVYVDGMTMDEARDRLREELGKIYSGISQDQEGEVNSQLRISLGNIRSINVTILGNVQAPGSYTLTSLATVFNALYLSGGPDEMGTFRNIRVIRNDSIATTLDIYQFLVYGEQSGNIRLRDQDIIMVGPYEERVAAEGRLKRNGLFELKEGETIQDLLMFTGGFAEEAYRKRIKVIRETPNEQRIEDIDYPEQKGFQLQTGDSVYVDRILKRFENRIEINGAVYREGDYSLRDTTSVYSLIQRADGITDDAFTNRGLIYREREDLRTQTIAFNVQEVMNNPEAHDIPLRRNDRVVISSIFDLQDDYTISVFGQVQEAGTFPFASDMTLEDAILQADGFHESAAPYRIEVARRITDADSAYVPKEITKTYRFSVDENLSLNEKSSEFTLQPFDQVYVRSSPAYYAQQNVSVEGQVLFPGEYSLRQQDMRISDLIEEAGGLTRFAYTPGANLTREVEQEIDTSFVNIAGDSLDTDESLAMDEIKVGIDLQQIMENPHSKYDLILREGDVLEIPRELQTVRLAGEVLQPVNVRYDDSKSFREYIRSAGGATNAGEVKDAYIVYANGEVDRANRFLFFRNYPDVEPGATIYVPEKEIDPGLSPQERIAVLSTVVSMLAVISNTFR